MPEEKENIIPYNVLSEVVLRVGDTSQQFKSGCTILDLDLKDPCEEILAFIEFKNYYTSKISIRVKGTFEDKSKVEWKTILKDYVLMPDPHSESGSQRTFRIDGSKEFSHVPKTMIACRIILRQPSPYWSRFTIENLKLITRSPVKAESENAMTEPSQNKEEELLSYGIVLNSLASKLGRIAEMRSKVAVFDSGESEESGRFEVDGCYEVNLLSYT